MALGESNKGDCTQKDNAVHTWSRLRRQQISRCRWNVLLAQTASHLFFFLTPGRNVEGMEWWWWIVNTQVRGLCIMEKGFSDSQEGRVRLVPFPTTRWSVEKCNRWEKSMQPPSWTVEYIIDGNHHLFVQKKSMQSFSWTDGNRHLFVQRSVTLLFHVWNSAYKVGHVALYVHNVLGLNRG